MEDQKNKMDQTKFGSADQNKFKRIKNKFRVGGFAANNSTVAGHSGSTKIRKDPKQIKTFL